MFSAREEQHGGVVLTARLARLLGCRWQGGGVVRHDSEGVGVAEALGGGVAEEEVVGERMRRSGLRLRASRAPSSRWQRDGAAPLARPRGGEQRRARPPSPVATAANANAMRTST